MLVWMENGPGQEFGLYRIIFIIVITLAVAMGLLVGTLNSGMAPVDLLSALSVGLFLGLGLAWFFSILPLRVQLRKLRNASQSGSPGMLNNING